NGAEFIANIIKKLCSLWKPINIKTIYGKPHLSESQASIKKDTYFLKDKLSK
ncbi:6993_t:CDS:1, partial [Dentiscutata erythropus]